MVSHVLLYSVIALCAGALDATTWYTLTYIIPNGTGTGFLEFSGQLLVPPLPQPGDYYIWPGLEETTGAGVYQDVLDGRSGGWQEGAGWYSYNQSLQQPWGSSTELSIGQTVLFNNTYDGPNWVSTISYLNSDGTVSNKGTSNSFNLGGYDFVYAWFAIELYNVSWCFGPVTFSNITLSALGDDHSWCTDQPENSGNLNYSVSGVSHSVSENTGISHNLNSHVVTCTIEKIVLETPQPYPSSAECAVNQATFGPPVTNATLSAIVAQLENDGNTNATADSVATQLGLDNGSNNSNPQGHPRAVRRKH